MQALLPSPQLNAKDGSVKSPELPMSAQSNNSKAAKVESAIEYIKQLQKECSEKDRLLRERDEEMGALRKQLAALKSGEAATSPSSAEADSQTKTEKSASPGSENET
jgi:predicted nuclease with TOPRIM domain